MENYEELHGYQIYKGAIGAVGCAGTTGSVGMAGTPGASGPVGISRRAIGETDASGIVHIKQILSYDLVQNPDAIQYIGKSRIDGTEMYIGKNKPLTMNDL